MKVICVSKLPRPEQCGDWHDKPLKWKATGPGEEVQKFVTRKEAERYAMLRSMLSENDAICVFVFDK